MGKKCSSNYVDNCWMHEREEMEDMICQMGEERGRVEEGKPAGAGEQVDILDLLSVSFQ